MLLKWGRQDILLLSDLHGDLSSDQSGWMKVRSPWQTWQHRLVYKQWLSESQTVDKHSHTEMLDGGKAGKAWYASVIHTLYV